jgi:SHS2 domain-containing protein
MQRFEILPHTADIRIKATGSTRAGLMTAALKGMSAAAGPRAKEGVEAVERPFSLSADDFPSLLVDLLNEAVSLSDTHREAYEDIRFTLATDKKAEGAFVGRPIEAFETQIKAATHHDLDIVKNAEGQWEAVIVFDA